MSWLSSVGHTIGNIGSKAAPFVGMIPGVGPELAAGIGGLSGLMKEGGGLKGGLQGAVQGGLGGLVNKIPGVSTMLGKVGGALGDSIGSTFMPNGKLDLGKIISVAGAGANMLGQNKQRASAENYNNAQIDQRNQLMGQITGPQNFNLPDISSNVAGAYGKPKITPANNGMNPNAMASKKLTGAQQ